MSEIGSILLQDAADALRRRILKTCGLSRSDRAFLTWALQVDNRRDNLQLMLAAAVTDFASSRSYHHVATIGYCADAGVLGDVERHMLREMLVWLCGRGPEIVDEPAPFVTDAVALLGVALGAHSLGREAESSALQWLLGFVPKSAKLPTIANWQRCLFSAALSTLGSHQIPLPADPDIADIRTALRAHSVALWTTAKTEIEADEELTLRLLKDEEGNDLPVVRAALRLAAFSWIRRSSAVAVPGRVTASDLVKVLERVPAGMRRWTWEKQPRTKRGESRRWQVDNEYHVQNLLYFLLAPYFPDLKDEEHFSSIGQKQPRVDLFIPSLKLIVEVKFLRQGDRISKIIDELGSDASLYIAKGADYDGILAFVWDDSRRSEEHHLLRDGLKQIRGILDAVIISRPGEML